MPKILSIGLCGCDCDPTTGQPVNLGDSGFTYDEGKGVKDTIVMDGPLSQVYAKALNIYFAKKPVEIQQEDSLSAAFESAAIDAVIAGSLPDQEEDEENQKETVSINGLNIVSANVDIDQSPSAVIYTTTAKVDSIDKHYDVIEASSERIKNAGKDFVVFIGPEFGFDGEVKEQAEWVDFSAVSKLNAFNISDQFKRSTEEFFQARGIDVVIGFENLVEWVKNRSKR